MWSTFETLTLLPATGQMFLQILLYFCVVFTGHALFFILFFFKLSVVFTHHDFRFMCFKSVTVLVLFLRDNYYFGEVFIQIIWFWLTSIFGTMDPRCTPDTGNYTVIITSLSGALQSLKSFEYRFVATNN